MLLFYCVVTLLNVMLFKYSIKFEIGKSLFSWIIKEETIDSLCVYNIFFNLFSLKIIFAIRFAALMWWLNSYCVRKYVVTRRYKTYTLRTHHLGNHFNKLLLSYLKCIGWLLSCRIWFTNSSVNSLVFWFTKRTFPYTCIVF